ncbi:Phenylalanine N-monooxygenase [Vitis vinifera]|uniref:Phenylalanine N-monooxygenase n=1 Tax=Vitis vinifera TaxID=29760 RepID=A0A438DLL6_VITVI|nr:Phenylalanine N-monooxygenase [Vitis vinifera]
MIKQPGILSKAVKKLMEWLERIDEFRNPTSVAGYSIPKGSHVLLSRLGLGRNPRIWEEPLNFNPERHLNASTSSSSGVERAKPSLHSFSTGRRGCAGMLARLLQGFTWSPPPGQKEIDFSESRNDLSLLQNLCMP